MRDSVAETLPRVATTIADNWTKSMQNEDIAAAIKLAYTHRRQERQRLQAVDQLRVANDLAGNRGGW